MKGEDRKNVASVIEANSQWVTLQQLVDQGKSHVRVISRKKTLQLIEAVVDDAIRRATVEVAQADRQRIVTEANDQFHRVSRIQAESEAVIRQQKELLSRQQAQIQKLEQAQIQFKKQISLAHDPRAAEHEKTTRLQAVALEEAGRHVKELADRERKASRALARLNRRMTSLRETIAGYDREMERLAGQVKEDATLIHQLRTQLNDRERELGHVKGLLEALSQEVAAARAGRGSEPEGMSELRSQFAEMKTLLESLGSHGNQEDRSAVQAMLEKISQNQVATEAQMEDHLRNNLNHTLDKIDQALRVASTRAIDRPVEATDIYVSKIFDDDIEMESNLSALDIQATTAKQSISDSLERLKRLRSQASRAIEQDAQEDQEESTDQP